MKYKQLDNKMKDQIDVLLKMGYSMRKVGREFNISHSTVSRYKNNVYTKRQIDITLKCPCLVECLKNHYDSKARSIEVCIHNFRRHNPHKPSVSPQKVGMSTPKRTKFTR